MRRNRLSNRLPHRSAGAGSAPTGGVRAGIGTSHRVGGNRPARAAQSVAAAGYRPIRTVLVPVDGSPLGEHALPLAVRVARAAGAALRVVHVYSAGSAAGDAPRLLADGGWVRGQRRHRGEYLNGLARRLTTTGQRPPTTVLLDGADVAGAVCEAAAGADLVVMATRGRGPWARLWHGSVAADVARRSRVPVLQVRGGEDPPDFTGGCLPRHILVPSRPASDPGRG
jgi:nucleotide-binding universal stress UspA family protein